MSYRIRDVQNHGCGASQRVAPPVGVEVMTWKCPVCGSRWRWKAGAGWWRQSFPSWRWRRRERRRLQLLIDRGGDE